MQEEARQIRLKLRELCIYLQAENTGFYPDQEYDSSELNGVLKLSPLGMLTYVRQRAQDIFQQSRIESKPSAADTEVKHLQEEFKRMQAVRLTQTELLLKKEVLRLKQDLEASRAQLSKKCEVCEQTKLQVVQTLEKETQTKTLVPSLTPSLTQTKDPKMPSLREKARSSQRSSKAVRVQQGRTFKAKNVCVSPVRLELDPTRSHPGESIQFAYNASQRGKKPDYHAQAFQSLRKEDTRVMRYTGASMSSGDNSITTFINHLQDQLHVRSSSNPRVTALK
jgi:hypothetical protein